MGKNSKPILSVLVDSETKDKFADLARRNKYSMGWLLNDCIDRMLQADSISIYRDSIGNIENNSNTQPDNNTGANIEELVKSYVDNYLSSAPPLSREDVEKMINTSIDNIGIEKLVKSSIGVDDIEKIINTFIGIAIEPVANSITKLETHTRERFEELEARSIATVTPTIDKEPNTKSWVEFFKMIGMDALKAGEARLTVNSDTRNKQATEGILTAKEQGLGDWVVKLAGQSFVKLTEQTK